MLARQALDIHYIFYLGLFFLLCIVQHDTSDHWQTQQTAFKNDLLGFGWSQQWWRPYSFIVRCWLQFTQDSVTCRSDAVRVLHWLCLRLQNGGCGSCTNDIRSWHLPGSLSIITDTPQSSTQGGAVPTLLRELVPVSLPATALSAGKHRKPDGGQGLHGWASFLPGTQENDSSSE